MIILPFKADHFWNIKVQKAQAYINKYVTQEALVDLEKDNSFTCFKDDKIIACFGWFKIYPTRGVLWSYLSEYANKNLVEGTRIARKLINDLPFKRLEIEVDCEFEQGHRWARMLGFELETERSKSYRIDGNDSSIYVRIRQ